jgi:hypothetical protein
MTQRIDMLRRREVDIFQTRGYLGSDPKPEGLCCDAARFRLRVMFTPDPGHFCAGRLHRRVGDNAETVCA